MSSESSDSVECPQCGVVSEGGDRFCRGCGGDLAPVPVPAASPAREGAEPVEDRDIESPGLKRLLWVVAGVLVMAGLIGAVVLTERGSDPESGTDAVAGGADTTAPEVLDPAVSVSGAEAPSATTPAVDESTVPSTVQASDTTVVATSSTTTSTTSTTTTTVPAPAVLFPVRIDGRFGFIDRSGNLVVDPIYENAGISAEGLASVETADGWGYIDMDGTLVIDPLFAWAYEFSEGSAPVFDADWRIGFIDRDGVWLIDPAFDNAYPFSDGLASAEIEMTSGYVDTSGKWVIEPRFWVALPFSGGVAAVMTKDGWGFIDRSGAWVIEPQFDRALSFSEDLAAVQSGELWGYIDHSGAFVIQPKFQWAGGFSDGLAPVQAEGGYGYINSSGELVIPAIYAFAMPFQDGLGQVSFSADTEEGPPADIGYIDTSGAWVWEPSS